MKYLIITTIMLGLVGCQTPKIPTPTLSAPLKSQWQLQHAPNATLDLRHLPDVHAYMGCNQITLNIQDFGDGQLQTINIMTTDRACPNMALEEKFIQFLSNAQYYQINNSTLTLSNDAGKQMTFALSNQQQSNQ